MGFSQRIDTILNWTELRIKDSNLQKHALQVPARLPDVGAEEGVLCQVQHLWPLAPPRHQLSDHLHRCHCFPRTWRAVDPQLLGELPRPQQFQLIARQQEVAVLLPWRGPAGRREWRPLLAGHVAGDGHDKGCEDVVHLVGTEQVSGRVDGGVDGDLWVNETGESVRRAANEMKHHDMEMKWSIMIWNSQSKMSLYK